MRKIGFSDELWVGIEDAAGKEKLTPREWVRKTVSAAILGKAPRAATTSGRSSKTPGGNAYPRCVDCLRWADEYPVPYAGTFYWGDDLWGPEGAVCR